mmetsp:Transcript_47562/g.142085  ORF Transcript_47562/g.142085 Transcript_47562/m.142085 type:complete len:277 (-) Transcript_47562:667-1497(-)
MVHVRVVELILPQPLAKLGHVLRASPQLLVGQPPVAVKVQILEHHAEHCLVPGFIVHRPGAFSFGTDFRRSVNHDGYDKVKDPEDKREGGTHEDNGGPGLELDDGAGHLPPVVPSDGGLEEREACLRHRGKRPWTPRTVRPLPLVRQLRHVRMDQHHGDVGPDADAEGRQQDGPEERPGATPHQQQEPGELPEEPDFPNEARKADDAEDPQGSDGAKTPGLPLAQPEHVLQKALENDEHVKPAPGAPDHEPPLCVDPETKLDKDARIADGQEDLDR